MRTRNALYAAGYMRRRRLPRPVISIGNLTLGGAGKTPFAIYVAHLLCELGAIPALLSRGYGRESADDILAVAPGDSLERAALVLGDEPALVRREVPAVWLGISNDRYSAGRKILERGVTPIFILDDGFQHLKLHRDLDVLILDRTQPLRKNRVIPGGSLREPVNGLRRAQVVVINESLPRNPNDDLENFVHKLNPEARVYYCTQRIDSLTPFSQWQTHASKGTQVRVSGTAYLVAALGNPERFRLNVEALGLEVRRCRFFRDHRRLSRRDWEDCGREARKAGADILITTEKDAIKLDHGPDLPLFVASQSVRLEQSADFAKTLRGLIEGAI